MQAVGGGLVVGDVVHADDGIEGNVGSEAVESELGFVARAAGENGEAELPGELFEHAGAGDPLLAQDQAGRAVSAEEELLEMGLHGLERNVDAERR